MTRGQFGSADDVASDESTYTTLNAGASYGRDKAYRLGFDLVYVQAEESLDPFSLPMTDDAARALIDSSYDFSEAHTYSDLDVDRWEVEVSGEVHFTPRLLGEARFSFYDFEDNDPYLEDLTGSLSVFRAGLRWQL